MLSYSLKYMKEKTRSSGTYEYKMLNSHDKTEWHLQLHPVLWREMIWLKNKDFLDIWNVIHAEFQSHVTDCYMSLYLIMDK